MLPIPPEHSCQDMHHTGDGKTRAPPGFPYPEMLKLSPSAFRKLFLSRALTQGLRVRLTLATTPGRHS